MLSQIISDPIGVEDLTLLANLSEKDINENLKLRFRHNLIYTNIGNVLLSINPYKAIPFLYDSEMIEFYKMGGKERSVANVLALRRAVTERVFSCGDGTNAESATHSVAEHFASRRRLALGGHHEGIHTAAGGIGGSRGIPFTSPEELLRGCPQLGGGPHVFQLANCMYRQLLNEEENQAVIISGESGAGKTEASKQIINFIAYISEKRRRATEGAGRLKREAKGEAEAANRSSEAGAGDAFDKIKSMILESNPLMEAFGNAKTAKNDNSSRFGKFFEIYFLKNVASADAGATTSAVERAAAQETYGMPIGGHMSVFLLEKSRVVQQQQGERNFHIFYQLLAGLDAETKAELRLDIFDSRRGARTKPGFNYLCSGRTTTVDRVDDRAEFERTRSAMRAVGISDTVQRFIFEALAIILHLGELEFTDDEYSGSGGRCRVENRDSLDFVASLLKLESSDALEKSLTVKNLQIGERREGVKDTHVQILEVPLDLTGCANNRDAVAKLLYDALFNFIVYFVNHSLEKASAFTASGGGASAAAGEREDVLFQHFAENMKLESAAAAQEANAERFLMLGVLDIYGFEIFANNSFEQFCINYINEKLHQIFIDLTLKKEQEEYEQENVTLPQKIDTFFDNKRILNVIEGTSGGEAGAATNEVSVPGMFQLLDDVCVSLAKEPEEVADAKFLEKLDLFLSSSQAAAPFFQKSEKSGYFTVKHYAGSVVYNVNGFVAKNKDRVSNAVLEALRRSENIFVTEILSPTIFTMDEEGVRGGGGGGGRRRQVIPSAGRKIREQADNLVAKLRQSTIHYIRTIKPNEEKKPDLFVDDAVLHQVQYLGLMENVRIRKMGFIYRSYFDVFLQRFHVVFSLLNERLRQQEYRIPSGGGSSSGGHRNGGGSQTSFQPFNFLEHDDKEGCRVLLTFVQHEAATRHASFDASSWQLGNTKVFVRQPAHLITLERLRESCVETKVRKIQRCYRAYVNERENTLLKRKMARLYARHGKTRRTDSLFRVYSGDYLDVKNAAGFFRCSAAQNHHDLRRILRYDPLAVGWREVFADKTGQLYYVNLFTGESQWEKPAAMAERELYNNYLELTGGAEGGEAVNVDGVRVIFSAKVDRVVLVEPIALSPAAAASTAAPAFGGAGAASPEALSAPFCALEECILVATSKAVFLLREVIDAALVTTHGQRHSTEASEQDAPPSSASPPVPTVSSHLVLVKRIDLRLLRGVTVSPHADDFLFLHVYPQNRPARPVFHEPSATGPPQGVAQEGVGGRRKGGGRRNQRRGKGRAAPPPVLCACCGRILATAAVQAHCPCCGRLCCRSMRIGESCCLSPHARRPLPTLLGTNTVDPSALAGVASRKEAVVAAMEAAVRAQRRALRKPSRGSKKAATSAVTTAEDVNASIAAAVAAVPGASTVDILTADEVRTVGSVSVCPLCTCLEPLEANEDVIIKSFLRTELAAFILREYQRRMGFPLPFTVAGAAESAESGGRSAVVELSLGHNEALHRLLQQAATVTQSQPTAATSRGDSKRVPKRLLTVAAALAAAPAKQAKTKVQGERADVPSPPPPPTAFASYRRVTVVCVGPTVEVVANEGGGNQANEGISTMEVMPSANPTAPVQLIARAPAGLSKAVVDALEARREERRRQHERRRREEEAALRAKAAAKERDREEAYNRMVEEKKQARREREEQERNARIWKEEEQRIKREAAARAVAEKTRKGF